MKLIKPRELMVGHRWCGGIAAGLATLLGLILLLCSIGGGVTRLSFDLPFAIRGDIRVNDAVLVYLDEISHKDLGQPMLAPWDRSLHARLLDQLSAQGAKAVVFDILFTEPSADPAADQQLARAIQQNGRVILAGNFQQFETTPGAVGRMEELPYEPFRSVAAGWGNVNLMRDSDFGIRSYFPTVHNISGFDSIPWLPCATAQLLGASENAIRYEEHENRWLNYYCPPDLFPACSYSQALMTEGVPPGFFKDKVVFIGGKLSADFSGKGKDEFLTPYAYWGKGFAPGVEILATACLNLMRGDWLTRLPLSLEFPLVVLTAVLAGFGLACIRPLPATFFALGSALAVSALAILLFAFGHIWFAWLILPIQIGLCLLCSVIHNSVRVYVEKSLVEESLGAHLSPTLVKQLIISPNLRRPGGTKQEVSILFTDIANFSRVSESLHPDDLVKLLNRYYEAALECIHETDGTVVDLIGDAIFAIWNAPVEQTDHRIRACEAAMKLHQQLIQFDDTHHGPPLRTRVGLHTGTACVGNIGSQTRFSYTAIGENTNLASRLEGLNKHLGTHVLATREIQRAIENKMVTRLIGHFQFKGSGRPVEIHEFLGPIEKADSSHMWRETFARALHNFRQRKFDEAERHFRQTIELRKMSEKNGAPESGTALEDGPSRFYLDQIAELRLHPPGYEWIGEISLHEK